MAKKVVEQSEVLEVEKATFLSLLLTFLNRITPRTRDIVGERFGLFGSRMKTLEEIGKKYGITRERVRQILQSAYSFVKQRRDDPAFVEAANRIVTALRDRSGIMKTDEFLSFFANGDSKERGALSFFLECMKQVKEERETTDRARALVLSPDFSEEKWKKVAKTASNVLEAAGRTLTHEELWREARKQVSVGEEEFFHYLTVSARIKRNPFGFWGFADSAEISPRGTREKAYLVLKMAGSPLHFKEIAKRIDESGLQKRGKKTHPQTVHNELIKDKKFVLVGRGLYALSEWGYSRGTVREVLDSILRKTGKPMKRDDILKEIFKVRSVKRSTVVINLNTYFEKIGKDTYTVK